MAELSLRTRSLNLEKMSERVLDLAVIGGGVTGAGVALDASGRGMSVALLEKGDFASGTSSRSSRLVHGGIRYLEHGEFGLVRESLVERGRLLKMAPHLVEIAPFVLPILRESRFEERSLAIQVGLAFYDAFGGSRIGRVHRRIGPAGASELLPQLDSSRLDDAFVFWDARTDDARLTLSIVKTAALTNGALVANYCEVEAIESGPEGFELECVDRLEGASLRVRSKMLVNASGVWADRVAALAGKGTGPTIRPAKGSHIAIPREMFGGSAACLLPVPGESRFVFSIPWRETTIVGTTDTDYSGSFDSPEPTAGEIDYLLSAVNAWSREPVDRIVAGYSGLRPLIAASTPSTADLSRRHRISKSPSGMVTVAGGKLTTWRKMAADTVDILTERRGVRSTTERILLDGAAGYVALRADPVAAARNHGISPEWMQHLTSRYGGHATTVARWAREDGESRLGELGYLEAEIAFGVKYEMAATVDDLLERRTRASTENSDAARGVRQRVEEIMREI